MRRSWIVIALTVMVIAGSLETRSVSVSASGPAHASAAKKHCKKGYQLAHGKCKKRKPAAPRPSPTPTPAIPVSYVAIGDSLTFGTGADNPSTQSYPALIGAHLPAGTTFLNLGVPGMTLDGALTGELPQALAAHPSVATVWLGANDIFQGNCPQVESSCATEVATLEANLDRMLSALRDAHVRVFVANLADFHIIPATAGGDPQYCTLKPKVSGACWIPGSAVNAAIVRVAGRYNDPVIDVYAATKTLWGHPEFVSSDGLHLSTAGYAALADLFYGVMHAAGVVP